MLDDLVTLAFLPSVSPSCPITLFYLQHGRQVSTRHGIVLVNIQTVAWNDVTGDDFAQEGVVHFLLTFFLGPFLVVCNNVGT